MRDKIAQRIRIVREAKGMTQNDLAQMVNRSRPSIVNIEQGRQAISLELFIDIAIALGVSPANLLPRKYR